MSCLRVLAFVVIGGVIGSALAEADAISIKSEKLHLARGKNEFIGKVVVDDATLRIEADHAVVRHGHDGRIVRVTAKGNPVLFRVKKPGSVNLSHGSATKLVYFVDWKRVRLVDYTAVDVDGTTFSGTEDAYVIGY